LVNSRHDVLLDGLLVYNGVGNGEDMIGLRTRWIWLGVWFLGQAWASPLMRHPEVSFGSNPIRSISDTVEVGEALPVLTVPAGQHFVITAFMENVESLQIRVDGVVKLDEWALSQPYFTKGYSRISIESGSVIAVENTGRNGPDAKRFYMQGYFTAENSSHRYWNGLAVGTDLTVVFPNSESVSFMVRTIVLGSSQCAVYIDGTMVLDIGFLQNTENAFGNRRGTLLVPPASTLQVASPVGANCEYYVEGEYILP